MQVLGCLGAVLQVPGCPGAGLQVLVFCLLWSLLRSLGVFFFVFSSPAGFQRNWKEKESPVASLTSSLKDTPGPWLERCLDSPRQSLNRTWVGGSADMMNGERWVEGEFKIS